MSTDVMPLKLVGGLPGIIPGPLRTVVRRFGDPKIIRAVLTVISIYKVFRARPHLKVESITNPFTGIVDSFPEIRLVLG
jgi:hypothetical protein